MVADLLPLGWCGQFRHAAFELAWSTKDVVVLGAGKFAKVPTNARNVTHSSAHGPTLREYALRLTFSS